MTQREDGSYFAEGRLVHRSPEKARTENGINITIGFPVCQLSEWVGDEAAEAIAYALNAARSPAQEGGERPTVQVDASMIARLLTGGAVETAHCLLRPCEGLTEWGPNHTELLREAADVIKQLRETLHHSDARREDDAWWTLAKIQKALGDE